MPTRCRMRGSAETTASGHPGRSSTCAERGSPPPCGSGIGAPRPRVGGAEDRPRLVPRERPAMLDRAGDVPLSSPGTVPIRVTAAGRRGSEAEGPPATDGPPRGSASRVESVAKAARILATFQPDIRVLTVREIARRTDMPRSTCHAICATLAAEGLLERATGGGYRLGAVLAGMGAQVIERAGLVEAASPAMSMLSRTVGGEIHLGQFAAG
ncbi:MAG: helix-turn-helix domain-containing protein, partial [Actinobacteria bacterium]|nr:helix-turn-helix domain-containing protein [Actinomycetota bacterium]